MDKAGQRFHTSAGRTSTNTEKNNEKVKFPLIHARGPIEFLCQYLTYFMLQTAASSSPRHGVLLSAAAAVLQVIRLGECLKLATQFKSEINPTPCSAVASLLVQNIFLYLDHVLVVGI